MLSRAPEMIAEARAWVRGLTQSSPALTAEDVARLSAIEDVPQQSESSAASWGLGSSGTKNQRKA